MADRPDAVDDSGGHTTWKTCSEDGVPRNIDAAGALRQCAAEREILYFSALHPSAIQGSGRVWHERPEPALATH